MCEWRPSLGCSELLCPLQTPVPHLRVVVLERLLIRELQRSRGKERYETLARFGCLVNTNYHSNKPSLYVICMSQMPSTSTHICIFRCLSKNWLHAVCYRLFFPLWRSWLICIRSTLTLTTGPLTAPQQVWLLQQHHRKLPWSQLLNKYVFESCRLFLSFFFWHREERNIYYKSVFNPFGLIDNTHLMVMYFTITTVYFMIQKTTECRDSGLWDIYICFSASLPFIKV